MKYLGLLFSLAVVAFWIVMNTLLVTREMHLRELGGYRRGVTEFLGADYRRERWMSIYKHNRKIGYTGFSLEKVFADEGVEYHGTIETYFDGGLPFQGFLSFLSSDSNWIEVRGDLILDVDMKPLKLQVDLGAGVLGNTHKVYLTGTRSQERLVVKVEHFNREIGRVALPLKEITLSDGLTPSVPVSGYRVGDTYRLTVFDPVTATLGQFGDEAVVKVVSREPREVQGIQIDTFELETTFRGSRIRSWVTTSGEVIRQETGPPLDFILRQEPDREAALRGVSR